MLEIKTRRIYDLLIIATVLACLGVCLAACNESQIATNAYKTLSIAADTYDGSMRSAADLYNRGLLDDAGKQNIIDMGRKYKIAHRTATSALEAYVKTTGASEKERLTIALSEVTRVLSELSSTLPPFNPLTLPPFNPSPLKRSANHVPSR